MKKNFFSFYMIPETSFRYLIYTLIAFLIISISATAQEKKQKEITHTFYITSNIGLAKEDIPQQVLQQINKASKSDPEATLLLLGNITSKKGYPAEGEDRESAKRILQQNLLDPLEDFNGNIIITPGVNEWNKGGHENIDDLESFLQDNLEGLEFWPSDGCALEKEDINDDVVLVMVDSQWFLEDWDDHPYINNECEIKDREQFFIEFKDDLKDSHGKTVIVAVHHPVMTNTRFGFFDKIAGFSRQAYQNPEYRTLRGRLETLAQEFDDIVFVSGNDRNLQFLEDDGIPQIISGAATETQEAKVRHEENFASEKPGFAKFTTYADGSSEADFFSIENGNTQLLFSKKISSEIPADDAFPWKPKEDYGPTIKSSIYTEDETDKSGLYKSLWGQHYRDVYSKKIEAPVLFLDTLPGNLRTKKEGGGQQSRSLRFIDDDKHEFTLRALRKSAVRFLQANAVKDHYIEDYLQHTVAQRYVMDFYTTAHPYAPFAVNSLAEKLDILHVNPEIYYVPKQKALGHHNQSYGDELYMLEAHPGDENKDFEEYGKADDILSTTDLLLEMRETKDVVVDEEEYLRARLFDMLIGDWDRHYDQWRWAEYEQENGKKLYKPIPRDRDYAFPKYDGPIIALLKAGFPELRKMESYDENVDNVKWFNLNGYPLDKTLIQTLKWEDWQEQVGLIQDKLTDETIDKAFASLPEEVKDSTIERIKKDLKARRGNLQDIAKRYYKYLNDFAVITGTEEDDDFRIQRMVNGKTKISIFAEEKEVFSNSYSSEETNEIWIYGLNGHDHFNVSGDGDELIKLKVLGGEDEDTYNFENTRKAKLFDYKSKENYIKNPASHKRLVDSYDINNYDPDKRKYSTNKVLPSVDYSRDAGFQFGLKDTFTTYGLVRNPFTTKQTLGLDYFFATEGIELSYTGEFAHLFYNWNLGIEALYTSPNFTLNYFGTGNETVYDEDAVDLDYNRVQIQQWKFAPSLIWRNDRGSSLEFETSVASKEIEKDENRFIGEYFSPENDVFERQLYGDVSAGYHYLNINNPAFPSRGMEIDLLAGYKSNLDDHNNRFGYIKPSVAIDYPLHPSGIAVLATKIGGEVLVGDNYEFYDAANLGGNHNLRAYRLNRFNGKCSFYQSTDLRVGLTRFRTNFIPMMMGVTAGFDYGRVWTAEDNSERWHNDYGGSVWINGFYALTANIGYYQGDEGGRLTFTFGFNF